MLRLRPFDSAPSTTKPEPPRSRTREQEEYFQRLGTMICGPERHERMRASENLFRCLTTDIQIQRDDDGSALLLLGLCTCCGSTIARFASEEARRKLESHE